LGKFSSKFRYIKNMGRKKKRKAALAFPPSPKTKEKGKQKPRHPFSNKENFVL